MREFVPQSDDRFFLLTVPSRVAAQRSFVGPPVAVQYAVATSGVGDVQTSPSPHQHPEPQLTLRSYGHSWLWNQITVGNCKHVIFQKIVTIKQARVPPQTGWHVHVVAIQCSQYEARTCLAFSFFYPEPYAYTALSRSSCSGTSACCANWW